MRFEFLKKQYFAKTAILKTAASQSYKKRISCAVEIYKIKTNSLVLSSQIQINFH